MTEPPRTTQIFLMHLVSDGDVPAQEIREVLQAVGYHGVQVLGEEANIHECPCPSAGCLDELRQAGHHIPADTRCCICWGLGRAARSPEPENKIHYRPKE